VNKADVLRVAGECGIKEEDSFESGSKYAVGDVELERFAAAMYAAGAEGTREPDVLFNGYAVYEALDDKAKARTSAENISDVLDAVVRIIRALPITTNTEGGQGGN